MRTIALFMWIMLVVAVVVVGWMVLALTRFLRTRRQSSPPAK